MPTSGWPKIAFSRLAYRRSQASANSSPAPRVRPRMAAMLTYGALLNRRTMSVQTGASSVCSGTGRSLAAAPSKWLMKKSGTSLEKTTTWMSGSLSSPRTISCNVTTVSGITRFTGGFANVILAVWGVVRSRRIVLGWLIGWLHSVLVTGAD